MLTADSVLRILLRAVDVRPCCRVEDHVHLWQLERRRQCDVPVGPRQRDDSGLRELLGQRDPELPAGAGDENAAAQLHAVSRTGARSLSGSHQARFAAYQSTVASSPPAKPVCGCQPNSVRSFDESRR